MGAVLAASQAAGRSPPRRSRPPSSAASIASSPSSSSSSPTSAAPAAWAIRPQLGSRPNSAVLTSGELAIARATRSASAAVAASLTSIRPTRTAPSPSRTISIASCLQHRLQQALGQRLAGGAGRLQQDHVVGAHLAVDRDPVEGGVGGGLQRRCRVGDDGVGLDEAEHRRHVRLDHPRTLRLGGEGDAVDRQRAALGPAVGGGDRVGEGAAPIGRRDSRRPRRSPAAPPRSAAARRSSRSRRRPQRAVSRPSAVAARSHIPSASA